MKVSRTITGLLLGLALGVISAHAAQQANTKDVVAVVNGVEITNADLEQKQSGKLLKARDDYYMAQRNALNQLIEDTLLEAQAKKEGVTVDKLIDIHVNSLIKDPTDDQLEVFYEGLSTEKPFAEVRPQIIETIHQRRVTRRTNEYIKSLRDASSVVVMLAPPTAQVAFGNSQVLGPKDAPVKIIEFADYECPYCQKIYPDLKKLQTDFKGQVAFAFKDYPLPMHKHAEKAAEASRCAAEQGKYWEYHDVLFEKNAGLDPPQLKDYAQKLGLDSAKFDACLDSGSQAAAIKLDKQEGEDLGLTGTPTLFINGHFFSGTTPYATLHDMVAQEIAQHATSAHKNAGN